MSETKSMWPVAVNAAAGLFLAGVIVWQFAGAPGGGEGEAPMPQMTAAPEEEMSAPEEAARQQAAQEESGPAAVTGARIANADSEPGSWLAHGRTYSEQRFSPLDQITDKNVDKLAPAWVFDTGTTRGLEASPLVIDGVIYTTGNWGVVHALDAKTGEELWSYDPEVPGEWARYGCCDIVNRGVAAWEGKIFAASFDGRLIALDAKDGSVIWEKNTIPGAPYTITGAPRVVKGKVIIGNGGAEYGVRGYFSAYDANTGEQLWRFYTVPGDPSKPLESPALEKAVDTWKGGRWWEVGGGGTVWDSMAYDPELDTLYVGVGNGSPWTREIRSPGGGDNLYLSSILAIDPDTGDLKWHYQTTPGDNWDYTATQHIILADMEIGGETRKVLMQAPKNGFFYVIDRETGKLISADNYITVTWASHVDLETGRPVENPALAYDKTTQVVLPSANGGHNWHPMAYNPNTGLVYIPTQEIAGIYSLERQWREEREYDVKENWWNPGLDWGDYVDAINAMGEIPLAAGYLKAWDPVKQEARWVVDLPAPLNGGVLTTAGNLVFQGTADGRFVAYTADRGEKVWEADIQTGIIAPPISYAVDGEQYIAVMAGYGGVGIASGDARQTAAAKYQNEGRLLVFKVGGKADLPEVAIKDQSIPAHEPVELTEEQLRNGEVQFMAHCGLCHGALAISSGVVPDLRRMSPAVKENFMEIVRGGMLKDRGMASFGDLLSERDVKDIYGYIIKRAREDRERLAPAN
ncbi:pyrrolo-quinoline quinone [Tepidicaulis marinus]|uniref:Pyrrolo-quinoline quinone n=1 Tax=Tepidicaulis marinus TaxID=1333998 RepID=A0A081B6J9_9HYPH|nr:PQQ-dependent dehydrogenase, methanol/ethanol family [Tepidicaulis marinus]GAK43667.1 pyrrolo-quinoline quinone [Tepidicaulis marinus]